MKFTDQDIKEWEEGELGKSAEHVRVSNDTKNLDDALSMQLISIRLQKELITNLKFIASHYSIGYQPMVRDLLNRFVNSEMKLILKEELQKLEKAATEAESTEPVNKFMKLRQQAWIECTASPYDE